MDAPDRSSVPPPVDIDEPLGSQYVVDLKEGEAAEPHARVTLRVSCEDLTNPGKPLTLSAAQLAQILEHIRKRLSSDSEPVKAEVKLDDPVDSAELRRTAEAVVVAVEQASTPAPRSSDPPAPPRRRTLAAAVAERGTFSVLEPTSGLAEVDAEVPVGTVELGYFNGGEWTSGWDVLKRITDANGSVHFVCNCEEKFRYDMPTVTEVFELKGMEKKGTAFDVFSEDDWARCGLDLSDPAQWVLVQPAHLMEGKIWKGRYKLSESARKKKEEIERTFTEGLKLATELWKKDELETQAIGNGFEKACGPYGFTLIFPCLPYAYVDGHFHHWYDSAGPKLDVLSEIKPLLKSPMVLLKDFDSCVFGDLVSVYKKINGSY